MPVAPNSTVLIVVRSTDVNANTVSRARSRDAADLVHQSSSLHVNSGGLEPEAHALGAARPALPLPPVTAIFVIAGSFQ
jgi:hypothetical protein